MSGETSPVSHTFDTQQDIQEVFYGLCYQCMITDTINYKMAILFPLPKISEHSRKLVFVKYNRCACE